MLGKKITFYKDGWYWFLVAITLAVNILLLYQLNTHMKAMPVSGIMLAIAWYNFGVQNTGRGMIFYTISVVLLFP